MNIIYIYLYLGNTFESVQTDDSNPIIFHKFDCSGSESRLSSCSSSITSSIEYCSNLKVVKLTCAGTNSNILISLK